ncbi:NAD(P)H-dependent oxidoreductase [Fictibacillus barbaricus]|uniref:Glutathione-regulated potassium-efflux system ancillary protein KefG n=1 Tax=Fictibacillus barbaricus TaxID=182136 RepID=A0ABU1TWD2_9BACL|nr:NAD(P)H-dependent oxidoreductase [Fictibacillus barbaricus]MDR7071522.1 glutathione-regulated potassium-efflux system ancillary protein KefG [Fictibacillus barbaricus]
MKTLVLVAHPNLEQSVMNNAWAAEIEKHENVTVRRLYDVYPNEQIDVEEEQALLLAHDRIVFQFPFYWYSTPSLLKKWQDEVLSFGWAYGPGGDKLHGKQFLLALSTGGPEISYVAGGYNHYTISELLRPLQATSNLIGTKYITPFTVHGVRFLSEEQVKESAESYAQYVLNEDL